MINRQEVISQLVYLHKMQQKNLDDHHSGTAKFSLFRFSQSPEDKKLDQKARLKEKINSVVLEYLVQEGYQSAALELADEASILVANSGMSLPKDSDHTSSAQENSLSIKSFKIPANGAELNLFGKRAGIGYVKGFSTIEKRRQIKFLILKGDISQAIKMISTYYPTILDANNLLLFKLLRLNLIEMIRNHKSTSECPLVGNYSLSVENSEKLFLNDILSFVQDNLLGKVTHSMDLLRQLEITMSLLCFDFDHRKPSDQITELPEELRKLLNLSLRNECYRAVNRVILDLDGSVPSELLYHGISINDASLLLAQINRASQHYEFFDELDSSDVEFAPGPDLVSSIQSMISSVPELTLQVQTSEANAQVKPKPKPEDQDSISKLEEIAKLWLTTELILFLEKFIPEKRYLQNSADNARSL